MAQRKSTYSSQQVVSCLVMLLALAWLTISLPFVNGAQQTVKQLQVEAPEEDASNPLSNTTEEKSEGSTNFISEYLHDPYALEQNQAAIVRYYKCHPSDVYLAYHPDFFSPPPEGLI